MRGVLGISQAGYSLIELVVAILLLGMVTLAAQSGLHFGARVWERSQQNATLAHELDTSQVILRSVLSQSLPRFKGEYVTFSGEPSRISFDCIPPQAFGPSGTAHAVLSLERDSNSRVLAITLKRILDDGGEKHAVLLDGRNDLHFAYLDASGKSQTWLSYWRDRKRLPDAIRIAGDDPASWPTLIVRPLIAQDANCTLDPVSMTCRRT
jgi:general secretion pathway protein J